MEYNNFFKFIDFVDKVKHNYDLCYLRKTCDLERIWKMAVNDEVVRQLFDNGYMPAELNDVMLQLEDRAGMLFSFKGVSEDVASGEVIHNARHVVILGEAINICGGKSSNYIKGQKFIDIYNRMIDYCRKESKHDKTTKFKILEFMCFVRDEDTNSFLNEIEILTDYFLKNSLEDTFIDICDESRVGNGLLGYSCFEGYIERLAKIVYMHHQGQLEQQVSSIDLAKIVTKIFLKDDYSRGFIVLQMLLKKLLLPNHFVEVCDVESATWTCKGEIQSESSLDVLLSNPQANEYFAKFANQMWEQYQDNMLDHEKSTYLNEILVDQPDIESQKQRKLAFRLSQQKIFGFDPQGYNQNDFIERSIVAQKVRVQSIIISGQSCLDEDLQEILGVELKETIKQERRVRVQGSEDYLSYESWDDDWSNALKQCVSSLDDIVVYLSEQMKMPQKHVLAALVAVGLNKDEILAQCQYLSPNEMLTDTQVQSYIDDLGQALKSSEFDIIKSKLEFQNDHDETFLYSDTDYSVARLPGSSLYQKMITKIDEFYETFEVYYSFDKADIHALVRLVVTDKLINLESLRYAFKHIIKQINELNWSEKKSLATSPSLFVACYASDAYKDTYENFLTDLDKRLKDSAVNPKDINIYPRPSHVLSFSTMLLLPELVTARIYKRSFLSYKKQFKINKDELLPLHHAATWGSTEIFQEFMPNYNLDTPDSEGHTALAHALYAPDLLFIVKVMQCIVRVKKVDRTQFGYDLMHLYLSQYNVGMGTRREQIAALLLSLGVEESAIIQKMTRYNNGSSKLLKPYDLKEWLLAEGYIEVLDTLVDKGQKLDFNNERFKRFFYQGLKSMSGIKGMLLSAGDKFSRRLHMQGAPMNKRAILSCADERSMANLDSIENMRYILEHGDFKGLNIIFNLDQTEDCVFSKIFKQSHCDFLREILDYMYKKSINISDIGSLHQKNELFKIESEFVSMDESHLREKLDMIMAYQRRIDPSLIGKTKQQVCESFNCETVLTLLKDLDDLVSARVVSQVEHDDTHDNDKSQGGYFSECRIS